MGGALKVTLFHQLFARQDLRLYCFTIGLNLVSADSLSVNASVHPFLLLWLHEELLLCAL